MTIELHNCRTVSIRAVMPPPAPTKPLAPKLSMAEEAKLVRARFAKTWGRVEGQSGGSDVNLHRKAAADARRDELADLALDLIRTGDFTSTEIREHLRVSENQMRNALGLLRADGVADFVRMGRRIVWKLKEAAE
jgi:hypothetical protein